MAKSCYCNMFSGCVLLTQAPELPATTLAFECYYGMFSGCVSLVVAPELPATKLANYCYYNMFNGCSSLAKISAKFTEWTSSTTNGWVESVASDGVFICQAALPDERGGSRIPTNWARSSKDVPLEPLRFVSEQDGSKVGVRKIGSPDRDFKLKYKVDDGQWQNYVHGTTGLITVDAGHTVWFAAQDGVLNTGVNNNYEKRYNFYGEGSMKCLGGVSYLVRSNGAYFKNPSSYGV